MDIHCNRRSAEISEKCIRHHINACVLALRDAVWRIISGERLWAVQLEFRHAMSSCLQPAPTFRHQRAICVDDTACALCTCRRTSGR